MKCPESNEEWFSKLSTEEKAEWFAKKSKEIIDDFANFDFKSSYKDYWIAWLKEVHEA